MQLGQRGCAEEVVDGLLAPRGAAAVVAAQIEHDVRAVAHLGQPGEHPVQRPRIFLGGVEVAQAQPRAPVRGDLQTRLDPRPAAREAAFRGQVLLRDGLPAQGIILLVAAHPDAAGLWCRVRRVAFVHQQARSVAKEACFQVADAEAGQHVRRHHLRRRPPVAGEQFRPGWRPCLFAGLAGFRSCHPVLAVAGADD